MGDWSVTFPPEIIYYIIIPLLVPLIAGVFAWSKRREVTAVRQYVLDELKKDVEELKEKVRTLELLSPGSFTSTTEEGRFHSRSIGGSPHGQH